MSLFSEPPPPAGASEKGVIPFGWPSSGFKVAFTERDAGVSEKALPCCEPWSWNPAAETPLEPLKLVIPVVFYFGGVFFSQTPVLPGGSAACAPSSSEGCHRMFGGLAPCFSSSATRANETRTNVEMQIRNVTISLQAFLSCIGDLPQGGRARTSV